MNKRKRITIIIIFLIASLACAYCSTKVAINYDVSDYLDDQSQTKIALKIIGKEFGKTGSLQVMIPDIEGKEAEKLAKEIAGIDHIKYVNFDRFSKKSYKDRKALFVILSDGDDFSENALQIANDLHEMLDSRYENVEYGGAAIENQDLRAAITTEVPKVLVISIALVIVILLLTAGSWLEPFLLLAACGIAVIINKGTNIIFEDISYITDSISAILQLALSVDYSIILLHTFRRKKNEFEAPEEAMESAIKAVFSPVSASALTTIAGLVALLFMSFRIGFDIGIVLMKGIVISAITAMTLFPVMILAADNLMNKTAKRALVPKGKAFCNIAFRAAIVVVPLFLALVGGAYYFQQGNEYVFTDKAAVNKAITKEFGSNNTIVVVYRNGEDNNKLEKEYIKRIKPIKRSDGNKVLTDYTAYSNTVSKMISVPEAARKVGVDEEKTALLYTLIHLEKEPERQKLTQGDFVNYTSKLLASDKDVSGFADAKLKSDLDMITQAYALYNSSNTSAQLAAKLSKGAFAGSGISGKDIDQLYLLYFKDSIKLGSVDYKTMLNYIISSAETNADVRKALGSDKLGQLKELRDGITQLENTVKKNRLALLLPKVKKAYQTAQGEYSYEEFGPATSTIVTSLTDNGPVEIDAESVKTIYQLYFAEKNPISGKKLSVKEFVSFTIDQARTNPLLKGKINKEQIAKLKDLKIIDSFMKDTAAYDYKAMADRINSLQEKLYSVKKVSKVDKDICLGVYCKYAMAYSDGFRESIEARSLIDYLSSKMNKNLLLKKFISQDQQKKILETREEMNKANDLFCSKNYSRLLLSVDLPNEGDDTARYVEKLTTETKNVLGEDAYVAGEIISINDLAQAFDHDNRLITLLTILTVFAIVLIIFRSLSIPLILIMLIQGAIWIAFAIGYFLHTDIFFMSFIVTTCILMGATIDYGILMSSNYVALREEYDRKEALMISVERAMPTVFTSGSIMTICGLVVSYVSTQISISCVGLFVGIGALVAVIIVAVVLPSVLYLLDGFILKLSMKKKNKQDE